MSNEIYGDLETFQSADSGTYGFGTIISNEHIKIRGTGSASTTTTITSSQTSNRHLLLPNTTSISDSILSSTSTDIITNKTITDVSNVVYCDAFKTAAGTVIISGATPTGAGQVLVTTGSDTAVWATPGSTTASDALPLAGGTMMGNINMDNYRLLNIPAVPTSSDDAVSKTYVLGVIPYSDIALVISDTAFNTSDIARYSSDLALVISDTAFNTSDIARYSSDLALVISDTAFNTSDIARHSSDLARHTSDIARNTSDIAAISGSSITFVNWTNWTPTAGAGLKSPFTINAAKYTRLGNKITLFMDLSVTKDITSDTILINGLPLAVGTFGAGNKIANMVYIKDNSDNSVSFGRFVLDQASSTTLQVNLNDFVDSHGYSIQGQVDYSL